MLKVAAAATLEPEIAPNTPLAAITTEASPPGSQPSHLSSAENRRFTAPLPENTAPMKMKSGMASSVNELSDSHADHAICTSGLSTTNTSPTAATRPIAMPISRPTARRTSRPAIIRAVMSSGLRLELLGAEFVRLAAGAHIGDRLGELRCEDQREKREAHRHDHLRPLQRKHQHRVRSHVAGEGIGKELPAHPCRHPYEEDAERERRHPDPAGEPRA